LHELGLSKRQQWGGKRFDLARENICSHMCFVSTDRRWNFLIYLLPMTRCINLVVQVAVATLLGVVAGPIFLVNVWKELKGVRETRKSVAGH
jgi:hypothetical protein